MKGSYLLAVYLQKAKSIIIGALGEISFRKGFYIYVGSALGEKGSSSLLNRVKRHVSPPDQKKTHWHIDYLLNDEDVVIITLYLIPSGQKMECDVAAQLLEISDGPIKNFGSSDCNCESHLFYFERGFPWG